VQFAAVVFVSAALAIFFAAWAADARVEARSQTFASMGAHRAAPDGYLGTNVSSPSVPQAESEKELWESSALFLCPLH
jgi:hypothetical protein